MLLVHGVCSRTRQGPGVARIRHVESDTGGGRDFSSRVSFEYHFLSVGVPIGLGSFQYQVSVWVETLSP